MQERRFFKQEEPKMKQAVDYIQELLDIPSPTGFTGRAVAWLCDQLTAMGFSPRMTRKG